MRLSRSWWHRTWHVTSYFWWKLSLVFILHCLYSFENKASILHFIQKESYVKLRLNEKRGYLNLYCVPGLRSLTTNSLSVPLKKKIPVRNYLIIKKFSQCHLLTIQSVSHLTLLKCFEPTLYPKKNMITIYSENCPKKSA